MAREDLTRDERKARRQAKRQAAALALMGEAPPPALPPAPGALQRLDPATLIGDIDAWNLRQDGQWLRFDARLTDVPRGYLRPLAPDSDIIADAPGPLQALLALGGARRAGFNAGPAAYPHHVLAPADHIGAVGLEGTALASRQPGLQQLRHRSREALTADHLLHHRHQAHRGLPLILTRAETDGSPSLEALGQGTAFANLIAAIDNLQAAAASLGRPARVMAIGLDFGLEDQTGSATALARGHRALMERITLLLRQRGLPPPVFLMTAETGTARIADHPMIRAAWELACSASGHRLILTAPGYAAEQDRHGRPSEAGRDDLAALDAHALMALDAGEDWSCPLPLLAEYSGQQIRVTFRAAADLVLAADDPFRAGPAMGFRIVGGPYPPAITRVGIAADDPRALLLDCDRPLLGGDLRLLHACGLTAQADDLPINRSAIRDLWQAPGRAGPLHRWALPADLPLNPAPQPAAIRKAPR